ncbi:hypothetical protein GUJ93_ZPchr0011g27636 [Zizania palustris]|uniref:Uncharacterized protein n=1 Tax=Zizania palustris TaxID=103762 RepID=A0A8J6BNC7_ZIZPA|nr:hypothetical protein GUJ93_ZPchr0011g27636 [Zizania palustris]
MERLHLAVVLVFFCCLLIHASNAENLLPPPGNLLSLLLLHLLHAILVSEIVGKTSCDLMFELQPAMRVLQEFDATTVSSGADDQAAVAGEADEAGGVHGRMELELTDYPGSGANDRRSPWGQDRRN